MCNAANTLGAGGKRPYVSPTLIHTVRLKLLSLRLNDRGRYTERHYEELEAILAREVGKVLADKAGAARLDMDAEPVVSEMGVYCSALTGVDMKLYNSPCSIQVRLQERKMKLEKQ